MDRPYVIAALCAGTFVDDRDIRDALFGRIVYLVDPKTRQPIRAREPDGVWMSPDGPINTRLSAVLALPRLDPGRVAEVQPTLWLNPWAACPLQTPGPWRRMEASDGQLVERPGTRTVAEVFGLPERWPDTGSKP